MAELIRHRGELVRELLPAEVAQRVAGLRVQIASPDLSRVFTEMRSDLVALFCDEQHVVRMAVILEVQRIRDDLKEWRWPAYLGSARAKLFCPVLLLVLALKPSIARWARALIAKGLPSWGEPPIVLSAKDIPLVTSRPAMKANPEMAVLSAMLHP